jgi:hypothetical protein
MEIPLSKEICTICFLKIPPTLDSEGKVIWCGENEAWPITEGLCCDLCEAHVVLPRRAKNTAKAQQ